MAITADNKPQCTQVCEIALKIGTRCARADHLLDQAKLPNKWTRREWKAVVADAKEPSSCTEQETQVKQAIRKAKPKIIKKRYKPDTY